MAAILFFYALKEKALTKSTSFRLYITTHHWGLHINTLTRWCVRHVVIDCTNLRKFVANFMKIGQLVEKLKGIYTNTDTILHRPAPFRTKLK